MTTKQQEDRQVAMFGWTTEELDQQVERDGAVETLLSFLSDAQELIEVGRGASGREQARLLINRAKYIADSHMTGSQAQAKARSLGYRNADHALKALAELEGK